MIMAKKIYLSTLIALLVGLQVQQAHAKYSRAYTPERPLIIVSDWEFPPYEFRNDLGEPDGYNIEVLNKILDKLDIPHKFVMKEWYRCTEAFDNHQADLIHALTFKYDNEAVAHTQNMITYYKVKAVRLKSTPPLQRMSDLKEGDTLTLKKNDYVALKVSEMQPTAFVAEYHAPREALMGIRKGKYKYYMWGEQPLMMKVKELGLRGVAFDDTDMPAGELRIIGYDKDLIRAIDDMYARLEQSGDIQKLHDKWFHPERLENDASPIALILLIAILATAAVILLFSHMMRIRVKKAVMKSVDLNQMMTEALQSGNYYVIEYDTKTQMVTNRYGNMLPKEGITHANFMERVPDDEKGKVSEAMRMMAQGQKDLGYLQRRFNRGTAEDPDWRWIEGHAVVEYEDNKPRYIITSFRDYTNIVKEERVNEEIASKYQNMFRNGLIAMSFYDKEGKLIDVNSRMAELCEFDKEGEAYFRKLNLFEALHIKGQYHKGDRENFHVCQRMFYPEAGVFKFVEIKVRPTFDENGEMQFYVVTARDMSAERHMYLEQTKHDIRIRKATENIKHYEEQLGYLLSNSNMYVWSYNIEEDMVHFSRSGRKSDYTESIDKFFEGANKNYREAYLRQVRETVKEGKPYNATVHFIQTESESTPVWYAISGIPTTDKDGKVHSYFGVARNINNLMEAQQKLKDETQRAEESGKMKSAFLANMTHEIRTPLNAIVGFSDLLPVVEDHDERMQFIRIIRNNCDMLMRLINDILEASNVEQAVTIRPERVDFAKVFDDICQTLAQRVDEAGVEFIKDNPYDEFTAVLDKGRIQQVLTNFTTNAIKYTHEGHIKVGYKEQNGGIYFYCEDTGAGIPKEKQEAVFERFVKLNDFVQGTGLGLSICKAIAERCHGKIGVISEGEGQGSTFWMWIPRE